MGGRGKKPGFNVSAAGRSEGQYPATQEQLRSQMNLPQGWELDGDIRSVGTVRQEIPGGSKTSLVPSYVEADVRIGWHVFPSTELDFSGTDLLHERHLEANDPSTYAPQYVPRSLVFSLRQSF
jgi:hypothetical protein